MDIFLDPNFAYVILLVGIFLTFLAIATPGTGLLELSALFCMVFAVYAAYKLSIHWWALAILALSIIPFIFALRGSAVKNEVFLGFSILLLIVGSLFLFATDGRLISVNPFLAIVASSLEGLALWFILRKSMEAMSRKPVMDLENLVGQTGVARSAVHSNGNVQVSGELWSARSDKEIPSGSQIRVVRREGFVLVVERAELSNSK